MSSTTCPTAPGAADSLVPVLRRVLQTGHGPPAILAFVHGCGVPFTPAADWSATDERTARTLARRVADRLAPAGIARHDAETVVGRAAVRA